jgi:membrane protein DedA with SNARE-associated domain
VGLEGVGVPFPGETAVVAAAAYAGQSHKLSPWYIFAVAAIAAIAGNALGYLVGRKGGFPLARRYGRKVRLDEHKLKIGRYVLDTQGWKVIFVGRFVAVLRTYLSFLAGTLEMGAKEFFAASVIAAVAWSGLYTAAAYNAASTVDRLSTTFEVVIVVLAVLAVAVGFFFMRSRVKKLGEKAEAAYPGTLESV